MNCLLGLSQPCVELTSMKHKVTTAHDNMIFDEILMVQRILAKTAPNLQNVRSDLKNAETTLVSFRNILKQVAVQQFLDQ